MSLSPLTVAAGSSASLFPGLMDESQSAPRKSRQVTLRVNRRSAVREAQSADLFDERRFDDDAERWDGLS